MAQNSKCYLNEGFNRQNSDAKARFSVNNLWRRRLSIQSLSARYASLAIKGGRELGTRVRENQKFNEWTGGFMNNRTHPRTWGAQSIPDGYC